MGLRERLLQYIEYKGVEKATFERMAGLSNDAVNKMGDGTRKSTLDKISNICSDLNMVWLKTGAGEMLNTENNNITPHFENMPQGAIPHIEEDLAICGMPSGFEVAIKKGECELYMIPDLKGCDFTIRTKGRSMINRSIPERSIAERAIIGCRLWNSRTHIRWGEVYALATPDGVVVKQIMPSEKEGFIKCVSFNEEEKFLPYDLPVQEIQDWAIVVGVVSVTNWI